jgi:hypothetical protein
MSAVTRQGVDANMIASPVKNVPAQTESVLRSFALEIDDVALVVPYEASDGDTTWTRRAMGRVPYRDLHARVAEIVRRH